MPLKFQVKRLIIIINNTARIIPNIRRILFFLNRSGKIRKNLKSVNRLPEKVQDHSTSFDLP
ncbi:hypothetical protein [Bartonella sp. CB175]|uniref:hypothetical protein n=1 Tax=Bartonella sp. CB175 TaxID=3112256 RepID=UPI00300DDAA9